MEVATALEFTPAQVAVRWTMQRDQTVIPIIGATKPFQITDALGAAEIVIPVDWMAELNAVSAFELGFPGDFFNEPGVIDVTYGQTRDQIKF